MFIGHAAVAFASKKVAPRASLGYLMAAPFLLDLIWPILLLTGTERARVDPGNTAFTPLAFDSYPWSHSLLMSVVWGILFGAFYRLRTRDNRGAVVIAAAVVSHWILDFITHRPDLPLIPGSDARFGLGLWNSPASTIAVEGLIFAVSVWVYARFTRALDKRGRWGLAGLVTFFVVIYGINAVSPPPPSMNAVAWAALLLWLLPAWAGWVDRHRSVESGRFASDLPRVSVE